MFGKEEGGTAAVEFALVFPVLAALLLGIADGAGLFLAKMDMEHSVKAGAAYTAAKSSDTAGIKAAISGATGRPASSVRATVGAEHCMCPDGTPAVCTATCRIDGVTEDVAPGHFIDLTASTDLETFLPWPGLTSGDNVATLTAWTSVRIQ